MWTRDEQRSNMAYEWNQMNLAPRKAHGPFGGEFTIQEVTAFYDAKIRQHMRFFFGHDGTRQDTDGSTGDGNATSDAGIRRGSD